MLLEDHVWFLKWHINLHGQLNAKAIPVEEQQLYNLPQSWGNKRVYIFPQGICPKVKVTVKVEFKLTSRLQSTTLATETPLVLLELLPVNW